MFNYIIKLIVALGLIFIIAVILPLVPWLILRSNFANILSLHFYSSLLSGNLTRGKIEFLISIIFILIWLRLLYLVIVSLLLLRNPQENAKRYFKESKNKLNLKRLALYLASLIMLMSTNSQKYYKTTPFPGGISVKSTAFSVAYENNFAVSASASPGINNWVAAKHFLNFKKIKIKKSEKLEPGNYDEIKWIRNKIPNAPGLRCESELSYQMRICGLPDKVSENVDGPKINNGNTDIDLAAIEVSVANFCAGFIASLGTSFVLKKRQAKKHLHDEFLITTSDLIVYEDEKPCVIETDWLFDIDPDAEARKAIAFLFKQFPGCDFQKLEAVEVFPDCTRFFLGYQFMEDLEEFKRGKLISISESKLVKVDSSLFCLIVDNSTIARILLAGNDRGEADAIDSLLLVNLVADSGSNFSVNLNSARVIFVQGDFTDFSVFIKTRILEPLKLRENPNIEVILVGKNDDISHDGITSRLVERFEDLFNELFPSELVDNKTSGTDPCLTTALKTLKLVVAYQEFNNSELKLLELLSRGKVSDFYNQNYVVIARSSQENFGWLISLQRPENNGKSNADEAKSDLISKDVMHEALPLGRSQTMAENESIEEYLDEPEIFVNVLGPVQIKGIERQAERQKVIESVIYLAMHPEGVSKGQWAAQMWPDQVLYRDSLNTILWHVRTYLGASKSGVKHFPKSNGKRLRLNSSVTTDLTEFKYLAQSPSFEDWHRALDLIRGRPFQDFNDSGWVVLEGHLAEIETSIVDLAIKLAEFSFDSDNPKEASWAVRKALLGVPYDERLWRILLRATHSMVGGLASLESILDEMLHVMEIDSPNKLSRQTIDLYDALRSATVAQNF